MARPRTRTPQQRDARELARTRPADPYRGALKDPFTPTRPVIAPGQATTAEPTTAQTGAIAQTRATVQTRATAQTGATAQTRDTTATTAEPVVFDRPARFGQPGAANLAGILGIVLGLTLGIFGLLLVTIVSLQDEYGAPDRSFYRGTDSGYVVLGLIDFGLAALCGVGGMVLLTGRVSGRISITVGGWACLILAAFWFEDSTIRRLIPVAVAVVAAVMLWAAYTRPVTRWLGVLPRPQPE